MISKLNKVIYLILLSFLFVSVGANFYQHFKLKQKPQIETESTTHTKVEKDTVYVPQFGDLQILDPVPVVIDSFIAVYRDTFPHQYGWIATNETVRGDLLSKGLEYKFDIPTYYETRTVTKTTTNTVRNNLLFANFGLNYNYTTQGFYPSAGLTYIWKNHKRIISVEYSLDKRIDLSVGFSLWR